MAAESIKFLEHVGNKPFLLYHAFYSVHIPLQAKQDLIAKYEAKRRVVKSAGPLFRPTPLRRSPYFPGWLKNRNTPFLLPTMISGTPSPLMSLAMTCVPTPELSSIMCGMNCGPAFLSRRNSNQ